MPSETAMILTVLGEELHVAHSTATTSQQIALPPFQAEASLASSAANAQYMGRYHTTVAL
jgi:hypothetical protein